MYFSLKVRDFSFKCAFFPWVHINTTRQIEVQTASKDQRLPLSLPKRCGCLHCGKWKSSLWNATQTKPPRESEGREKKSYSLQKRGSMGALSWLCPQPSAGSLWAEKIHRFPIKCTSGGRHHNLSALTAKELVDNERVTLLKLGISQGNLRCALCPDITATHTHFYCARSTNTFVFIRRANATDTKSPRARMKPFLLSVWERLARCYRLMRSALAHTLWKVFRIIKIKCSLTTWFRCGADSLVTYVSMCTLIQFLFAALLFLYISLPGDLCAKAWNTIGMQNVRPYIYISDHQK